MKYSLKLAAVLFMALVSLHVGAQMACDSLLRGKSLWVIGDSYVRNHTCAPEETWHAKAAARLGMRYFNLGINGNAVGFDRTQEGFGKPMTRRYKEIPTDADYILVVAGHNDADLITNSTQWQQFTDSLNYLFSHLRAEYPHARIGVVTPWAVKHPNFAEVIAELKTAAARYGFPVLDMAYTSGIDVNNDEFRAKYFQNEGRNDFAHLNDAGHDFLVPYGTAFIRLLSAQPRITADYLKNS